MKNKMTILHGNLEDFAVTYTSLAMVLMAISFDDILGSEQSKKQTSWMERRCTGNYM